MPAPTRYRTLNQSAYDAALRERGLLTVWLDPSLAWHPAPSGKRGRQRTVSDAAIQSRPTIKVLFGLPVRQTMRFVAIDRLEIGRAIGAGGVRVRNGPRRP